MPYSCTSLTPMPRMPNNLVYIYLTVRLKDSFSSMSDFLWDQYMNISYLLIAFVWKFLSYFCACYTFIFLANFMKIIEWIWGKYIIPMRIDWLGVITGIFFYLYQIPISYCFWLQLRPRKFLRPFCLLLLFVAKNR